jgi:hypothetical protein
MVNKLDFNNKFPIYINPEFSQCKDSKELLLVGFGLSHPAGIKNLQASWKKHDSERKAYGRSLRDTKKIKVHDVGGAITLLEIDFENRTSKILADMSIPTPMGLLYYEPTEELLVGSAYSFKTIKGGYFNRDLNNTLFNTIHTLKRSSQGIYVVSTATDSPLEIDPLNPNVDIWDWIATENGYSLTRNGNIRAIDRNFNYQKWEDEGSSRHTTHINGVEEYNDEYILATLFHQDKLIKINKKTGRSYTIFSDLTNPHGIHKTKEGFIVSDTRGGKVILFDKNLNHTNTITGNFDWVQDAI